jgi:hypothetical protein
MAKNKNYQETPDCLERHLILGQLGQVKFYRPEAIPTDESQKLTHQGAKAQGRLIKPLKDTGESGELALVKDPKLASLDIYLVFTLLEQPSELSESYEAKEPCFYQIWAKGEAAKKCYELGLSEGDLVLAEITDSKPKLYHADTMTNGRLAGYLEGSLKELTVLERNPLAIKATFPEEEEDDDDDDEGDEEGEDESEGEDADESEGEGAEDQDEGEEEDAKEEESKKEPIALIEPSKPTKFNLSEFLEGLSFPIPETPQVKAKGSSQKESKAKASQSKLKVTNQKEIASSKVSSKQSSKPSSKPSSKSSPKAYQGEVKPANKSRRGSK